jgi:uncharacterized protein YceH (UPF0502 family)
MNKPIQALSSNQRRVIGVLVEKSKTTPDVYPMTINSIRNGCNQKSNRAPQMDIQEERVEDTLYELRELGAAIEVQSSGRVPKFKHELYEWLAVDKAELAVMAELLLRGEQTLGDLRARSSRMEASIKGIGDLVPVVNRLIEKGLIIELTPKGRGQMVTHNLYREDEVTRLQSEFSSLSRNPIAERGDVGASASTNNSAAPQAEYQKASVPAIEPVQASAIPATDDEREVHATGNRSPEIEELRATVNELIEQVSDLTRKVAELRSLVE